MNERTKRCSVRNTLQRYAVILTQVERGHLFPVVAHQQFFSACFTFLESARLHAASGMHCRNSSVDRIVDSCDTFPLSVNNE